MLHPAPRRGLVRPSMAAALALLAGGAAAQTPLLQPQGNQANDRFGAAVCVTDDLDGDGVPDLLVGAPAPLGSASAPGYAHVISGADGHVLMRLTKDATDPFGAQIDLFGASVAAATDGDGDGLRDLVIGCPASGPGMGVPQVITFLSSTGKPFFTFFGILDEDWSGVGQAVADPGDMNSDGFADLIIGAPSLSGEKPGTVFVYATSLHPDGVTGDAPGDLFGFAVAAPGDVDLDGVPDLLVGAPGGGYARVCSGTDGATLLTLPGAGGDFGSSVSAAGDIDGNGTPDLAVGAPLFNRVDILSGVDGALLRRFEKVEGEFGRSIAPLGDVNQDSVPDLLVGAPLDSVFGAAEAGTAFVISGATGQNLFKFTGGATGARLGSAAAAADLDGDGQPEMLLGAPGDVAPGGLATGSAGLYDGDLAGSVVSYGQGCPGSFLITPRLDLVGDPLPNGEMTIVISSGLGGAPAALQFGLAQGVTPLANGCILWVEPLVVSVGLVLDGEFPGDGNKTLVGRLPPDVPVGSTFSVQALIADRGTDGGIAGTSAFFVTVQ